MAVKVSLTEKDCNAISYSEAGDSNDRFKNVCWGPTEPGITNEIRSALLEILAERLAEANKQAEEA